MMNIDIEQHAKSLLDELVLTLKSLDLWQTSQPDSIKLLSSAPFCCDTLAFEQWLQFVFIPKIYLMINQKQKLPSKIALTPMAQESFKSRTDKVEHLIVIINKIDQLLSQQGANV